MALLAVQFLFDACLLFGTCEAQHLLLRVLVLLDVSRLRILRLEVGVHELVVLNIVEKVLFLLFLFTLEVLLHVAEVLLVFMSVLVLALEVLQRLFVVELTHQLTQFPFKFVLLEVGVRVLPVQQSTLAAGCLQFLLVGLLECLELVLEVPRDERHDPEELHLLLAQTVPRLHLLQHHVHLHLELGHRDVTLFAG